MFDRVVIASGTSNRQTRALASSVVEKVKEAGGYVVSVEGEDAGEWVLVDCGEVGRPRPAADLPRVLQPRRDLGRQAGATQVRLQRRRTARREEDARKTATQGADQDAGQGRPGSPGAVPPDASRESA